MQVSHTLIRVGVLAGGQAGLGEGPLGVCKPTMLLIILISGHCAILVSGLLLYRIERTPREHEDGI